MGLLDILADPAQLAAILARRNGAAGPAPDDFQSPAGRGLQRGRQAASQALQSDIAERLGLLGLPIFPEPPNLGALPLFPALPGFSPSDNIAGLLEIIRDLQQQILELQRRLHVIPLPGARRPLPDDGPKFIPAPLFPKDRIIPSEPNPGRSGGLGRAPLFPGAEIRPEDMRPLPFFPGTDPAVMIELFGRNPTTRTGPSDADMAASLAKLREATAALQAPRETVPTPPRRGTAARELPRRGPDEPPRFSVPLRDDGRVDRRQLQRDRVFVAPGGTAWRWNGRRFVRVR